MALPIRYSDLNLAADAKSVLNETLKTHRGQSLQEFGENLEEFSEMSCLVFYDAKTSSNIYLDKENLTFIAIVQSHIEGYNEIDKGASDYILDSQLEEETILKTIILAEKKFESRAEAKYRTLVESTSDGIWHHDLLTDEVVWSESLYQILGYQKELGLKPIQIPKLAHPDDREQVEAGLNHLVYKGKPYSAEFRIKKSDGKYIWVRAEGNGLRNGKGEVILILGAVRNIEKRKKAEIDLATSKNQIENIAKGIKGALARHRAYPDGRVDILYVSPGIEKMWDLNPDQVRANPAGMAMELSAEEREKLTSVFIESAKNSTEVDHTYSRVSRDGSKKWLRVKAIPNRLEHGVLEWDSITTDVTDIKEIEEKAEEQKLLLENIISNVDGVVQRYRIKEDGSEELIFISKGYEKVSGIPISEVRENYRIIWDQILDEDRDRVLESIQKSYNSLSPWEDTWRIKTRTGEIKWIQGSGSPSRQEDGSVIFD
ncbi:MAG: PAS domain-containing protein, partial [Bacteroidota bacterium]